MSSGDGFGVIGGEEHDPGFPEGTFPEHEPGLPVQRAEYSGASHAEDEPTPTR